MNNFSRFSWKIRKKKMSGSFSGECLWLWRPSLRSWKTPSEIKKQYYECGHGLRKSLLLCIPGSDLLSFLLISRRWLSSLDERVTLEHNISRTDRFTTARSRVHGGTGWHAAKWGWGEVAVRRIFLRLRTFLEVSNPATKLRKINKIKPNKK